MLGPSWAKRSLLAAVGLSVLIVACSGGGGGGAGGSDKVSLPPDSTGTTGKTESRSAPAPAQPPGADGSAGASAATGPTAGESKPAMSAPAPAALRQAAAPAEQAGGESGSGQQQTGLLDRLIIYTANLRLTVEDVPRAVRDLTNIARETCSNGTCGFVSESNLRFENDHQVATVSIQVPSDRYGEALNRVRELGQKITSETSKSQDVTEQFTDLESELRNLRATEERYLQLLRDARSIQDILTLEDRLRNVRGQIEKTQGRINYLQHRAQLATITVELIPPTGGLTSSTTLPQPVQAAQRAWTASLQFLSNVATVVVAVAVFFWWLIPILVIGLIVGRTIWTRRRAARPTTTAAAGG